MSFNAKSKRLYSAGKAFVRRNFVVTLVAIVILLQAIIWLAVRALEDTQNFYRCGDCDYPCGAKIQPEPKNDRRAPGRTLRGRLIASPWTVL